MLHQYLHEGKKPFMCNFCDTGSTSKRDVNVHVTTVHEGVYKKLPYKTTKCSNSCRKEAFKLPDLTCYLLTFGYLNTYFASVCEGREPYQCDICNAGFTTKQGLKYHAKFVYEGKEAFQ
jgi:hypothetical protein